VRCVRSCFWALGQIAPTHAHPHGRASSPLQCLRQDLHPVRAAGYPHKDAHWWKTLCVRRLPQGLHLLQAVESPLPDAHWRKALLLRHLRQGIWLQPRTEATPGRSLWTESKSQFYFYIQKSNTFSQNLHRPKSNWDFCLILRCTNALCATWHSAPKKRWVITSRLTAAVFLILKLRNSFIP